MSSKYDKGYQVTREEEGMYHRREIDSTNPKNYTTRSKEVVPVSRSSYREQDTSDDDNNFSEWTTSKKKVHHKTRQVETRVSRQLLVEDGKVIADSGPQVVTRIKEDNKVEECEKEKAPKNKGKFDAIECAPEGKSSGRVLGEKKEIQRVSREVREENMQYHDERYKELTGRDMHQKAIKSPHELITINDAEGANSAPRGKIVHYSNHGKKFQDTDEILEVAKLAIDGSITKEITRKKHHEEYSEDELPDEKGEAEALRHKPEVVRSSRRGVDYVNDFDDPIEGEGPRGGSGRHSGGGGGGGNRESRHRSPDDDEAFPRYQIDPLLNSLRDEDFKPLKSNDHSHGHQQRSSRYREHRLERKDRSDSSDDESSLQRSKLGSSSGHQHHHSTPHHHHQHHHHHHQATSRADEQLPVVEVPEAYRHHKERLMSNKGMKPAATGARERSFSPAQKSHLSHRSHKEDASVQAHLTDEEDLERRSSSPGANSHARATKQLQRQSTINSQRNYYYGKQRRRSPSSSSSSSSSNSGLNDPKDRLRQDGARSRDSGFKSPHSMRTATPNSTGSQQQIYSVSSKSRRNRHDTIDRGQAASPTPSAGQRSIKTTTTTMSAGLADRPLARNERHSSSMKAHKQTATAAAATAGDRKDGRRVGKTTRSSLSHTELRKLDKAMGRERSQHYRRAEEVRPKLLADKDVQCSMEDVSPMSSCLSIPAATTIKVPYKQLNEPELGQHWKPSARQIGSRIQETGSEMGLEEDIAKLKQRLANINSRTITLSSGGSGKRRDKSFGASQEPDHFDYKTFVANVQPIPFAPQQRTVDAYSVKVIQHSSPFHNDQRQSRSISELSNSIAQLELLSSDDLGSSSSGVGGSTNNNNNNAIIQELDNNNETSFNLDDYVKHKAIPVVTNSKESDSLEMEDEEDRISLISSGSLRSFRTYDIRYGAHRPATRPGGGLNNDEQEDDLNDEKHFPVGRLQLEEEGDEKKPAAWIYDIRDGSSTAIKAPPKPKKPEPAKIDAKELAQSRGGQSFYLEVIEPKDVKPKPAEESQLYSRWNSHGALNVGPTFYHSSPQRVPATSSKGLSAPSGAPEGRKSRQILPASIIYPHNRSARPLSSSNEAGQSQQQQQQQQQQPQRRQLPYNGPLSGNRSKSSSCLVGSTRPTKYSIYGGLRQSNGGNKPVPRLSYSRAIGPKSQRQIDAQPKTPSRYLKMK